MKLAQFLKCNLMEEQLPESWVNILSKEFKKQYFLDLKDFVSSSYQTTQCYPDKDKIFEAFKYCDFDKIKVVIIGQDPYHGPGQANGLSFSVNLGVKHPPSLVNIFKELEDDLQIPYPISGDLISWAKQGVLLLNSILTVKASQASSHRNKGWEEYTDTIINLISEHKKNVVFMLWGGYAKKKGRNIDKTKHCVLVSGHPSPLSANRGFWFGNKHFSKANTYLKNNGQPQINWNL